MFMSLQHKAPDRNHQQLPGPDPDKTAGEITN